MENSKTITKDAIKVGTFVFEFQIIQFSDRKPQQMMFR